MRSPHPDDVRRRVEDVLTDPAFDEQVDMVLSAVEPGTYRAASTSGTVTFARTADASGDDTRRWRYDVVESTGDDPLRHQSLDAFATYDDERTNTLPTRDDNAYPHAFDQIAQFFDAPHAPDLMVQHTSSHHIGTAVGQHGSLGIVQSRAPFILSGAGVPPAGTLARSARMVDVAPTFLRLLGTSPHPSGVGPTGAARPGALLARQDGEALDDLVEQGGAEHLVVFLLDGCNANVLYDAVARGTAPNVAALAGTGTTLGRGLMASFPTATLANHTTASTGVHPGHSGVLHNMWFDRDTLVTPDLLSLDQVFDAMRHLGTDVETVHEAIHRDDPAAFTAAVYELCDRGADYSSFSTIRDGQLPMLPQADQLVGATREFVESSGAYSFVSSVDELATRQTIELWERAHGNPLPRFTFLSFSLTDEAGHEAGPYADMTAAAITDCDARIGDVVDAVERAGALGRTAFAVIADHGMEQSDPTNTTSWQPALAGLEASDPVIASIRDVADGLVYVDAN